MSSCVCSSYCHTNYNTRICNDCGRETYHGLTPEFDYSFRALPVPYSRVNRFSELSTKLLGMGSGPKQTDPVWGVLEAKAPYSTAEAILLQLKRSKIINKHYSCLHLFARVFLEKYKPPPFSYEQVFSLKKTLAKWFEETIHMWNKSGVEGFFSYNWLIEQFLGCLDIECYSPYLKRLQCPVRRKKYSERWAIISQ